MTLRKMRNAAFFIILFALVSCDTSSGFRAYYPLSDGWSSSETIRFTAADIQRETSDIYIHIRNTNMYPYSNLFIVAELRDSLEVLTRDTLEYAMADPQGKWLGTGFMEVKESKLWWQTDWTPPHEGPYFIEFSQRVRNNGSVQGVPFLEGIISVGVAIEPQIRP
jgi:gliding motility-associated lipoprotein GldH